MLWGRRGGGRHVRRHGHLCRRGGRHGARPPHGLCGRGVGRRGACGRDRGRHTDHLVPVLLPPLRASELLTSPRRGDGRWYLQKLVCRSRGGGGGYVRGDRHLRRRRRGWHRPCHVRRFHCRGVRNGLCEGRHQRRCRHCDDVTWLVCSCRAWRRGRRNIRGHWHLRGRQRSLSGLPLIGRLRDGGQGQRGSRLQDGRRNRHDVFALIGGRSVHGRLRDLDVLHVVGEGRRGRREDIREHRQLWRGGRLRVGRRPLRWRRGNVRCGLVGEGGRRRHVRRHWQLRRGRGRPAGGSRRRALRLRAGRGRRRRRRGRRRLKAVRPAGAQSRRGRRGRVGRDGGPPPAGHGASRRPGGSAAVLPPGARCPRRDGRGHRHLGRRRGRRPG
mmetsp:Transcript_98811/g.304522  ORF Transcript_98811/g.304522 Transcript_98811/m.304522 type:complete len:385 (+) Transcript_98811:477-1631(+)